MNKKVFIGFILAAFIFGIGFTSTDYAYARKKTKKKVSVLLTKERALKLILPKADYVTPEVKTISKKRIKAIEKRLGSELILRQTEKKKVRREEKSKEGQKIIFYKGLKIDKKTKKSSLLGYAFINKVRGKWGLIEVIVGLRPRGSVDNVAIMSYKEKRGKPIKKNKFLKQFFGKTATDEVKVGKDIDAVSGATISSRAATKAVREALYIYDELYLK